MEGIVKRSTETRVNEWKGVRSIKPLFDFVYHHPICSYTYALLTRDGNSRRPFVGDVE